MTPEDIATARKLAEEFFDKDLPDPAVATMLRRAVDEVDRLNARVLELEAQELVVDAVIEFLRKATAAAGKKLEQVVAAHRTRSL